jgi:DNA-binding NarL/FixJ family response regulator
MMGEPRVLIVDDHPLFRDALGLAVTRASLRAKITEANALSDIDRSQPPDLVLLDLSLGSVGGFEGLQHLRALWPDTPVLVVSGAEPSRAAAGARMFGAAGFVPKSARLDAIAEAVEKALRREILWGEDEAGADLLPRRLASLTPAQAKVLRGILDGRLNKQIAYDLSISEATVKAHVTVIMRKLAVRNRTQVALATKALAQEMEPAL